MVAPKYQGDYGGKQLEDFSAADSEQFLDLVKLTKSLPYVNKNKMAAIGIEKGGQMVYQAIKNDVGLNAAAVFNTPTDLINLYNDSISARKKVFEEKYKAVINSGMDWNCSKEWIIEWIKDKTEIPLEI